MNIIDPIEIQNWHSDFKEKSLTGRHIKFSDIEPLLSKLKVQKIGNSVLDRPIFKYTIGTGNVKILIWSQMHGNESTGTKALFDLFKFFNNSNTIFERSAQQILENCTISCIPMLNPDGAEVYTRANANKVDLNRDILDLSQPESRLLYKVLKEEKPNYCFNLHDQRTIFTVGYTKQTATLSFLAPSVNEEREVTTGRKETMKVIVAMNKLMQKIIPGNIGRYNDEFYPTATGDNFQKMGHHTILIEAGHYKEDYSREKVRMFNFIALLEGLNYISSKHTNILYSDYFNIPNNTEYYLDIIYKNIYLEDEDRRVDAGFLFKEVLVEGLLKFRSELKIINNLSDYNADIMEDKSSLSFKNETELKRFLKKKC